MHDSVAYIIHIADIFIPTIETGFQANTVLLGSLIKGLNQGQNTISLAYLTLDLTIF